MPKINVYLPDDLAAAVRAAGFPVSPVCQQALADAVRAVTRARRTIEAIRDPGFDPAGHPALGRGLEGRLTARLREALIRARQAAGPAGTSTAHLLLGVLGQGDNLGLRLLEALDLDIAGLRAELGQAGDEGEGGGADSPAGQGEPAGLLAGLTVPAWRVLASALEAAVDLGHNYLGCEHLVLGAIGEPGSAAGRVLRQRGADPGPARRALATMVSGFAAGRQVTQQASPEAIGEILRRLEALEARVAALPGADR